MVINLGSWQCVYPAPLIVIDQSMRLNYNIKGLKFKISYKTLVLISQRRNHSSFLYIHILVCSLSLSLPLSLSLWPKISFFFQQLRASYSCTGAAFSGIPAKERKPKCKLNNYRRSSTKTQWHRYVNNGVNNRKIRTCVTCKTAQSMVYSMLLQGCKRSTPICTTCKIRNNSMKLLDHYLKGFKWMFVDKIL